MRRRIIDTSILLLYLIYFLSLIFGRPSVEPLRPGEWWDDGSESYAYTERERQREETFMNGSTTGNLAEMDEKTSAGTPMWMPGKIRWSPGYLNTVLAINQIRVLLDDPLLESDGRPESLARKLERAYILDAFLLSITLFWSGLILILLVPAWKREWFSRPMMVMLILPSILSVLVIMSVSRREQIAHIGFHPLILFYMILETTLLLGGLHLLYALLLPARPSGQDLPDARFMDHLRKERPSMTLALSSFLRITYHVIVIGIVALVISNVILLPVYQLQISYPAIFIVLLVAGVASLMLFYITAYVRVTRSQHGDGSYLTGLSFLGFRFTNNSLFLTGLAGLIFLILAIVVLTAVLNIGFLQTIGILAHPKGI